MSEAWCGHCPQCGAPVKWRERRPNGNDTCVNNHTFPSVSAVAAPVDRVVEAGVTHNEFIQSEFERQFSRHHPNRSLLKLQAGMYQDPNTQDAWIMYQDGAWAEATWQKLTTQR